MSSMFSGNPDQIKAKLNETAEHAQRRATQFAAVRQQIERANITDQSPDGTVRATVRASGALVELKLSDRVQSMQPEQIAAQVSRTIQRAQSRIGEHVQEIVADNGVDSDPAAQSIVARFAQEYPTPAGSADTSSATSDERGEAAAAPRHSSRPNRPRPDDDWNERSIYRR